MTNSTRPDPSRIVLILPCCIGDVVLGTATLQALRRGYPNAHITWAVGSWSKAAIEGHNLLDALLDTGPEALPVKSAGGFIRFVRMLRAGRFDLAVSLVRSPLMSAAIGLSGIAARAGLDSGGRGFGYTVKARINPAERRHEAEIYLDVARALGLETNGCRANVPVREEDRAAVERLLEMEGIRGPFFVLNPAGGSNPGMTLDVKRWPAEHFAALGDRLSTRLGATVIVVGGPADGELVRAVLSQMQAQGMGWAGRLSFGQVGALARRGRLYIGNDTGMTHLAAAAGARTVMILGPTDPIRYAPFTDDSLAVWKPGPVQAAGVADGGPANWDWARDGVSVDEVEREIVRFVG